MAKHNSVDQLVQSIHTCSMEESRNRLKEIFRDDEIQMLSLRLSLRCPLTQSRLITPAKGKQCRHLQCFDLTAYLTMNRNNPSFECPVCQRSLPPSELLKDEFVHHLLQQLPKDLSDVDINPDGSWTIPQPSNKRKFTPAFDNNTDDVVITQCDERPLIRPKLEVIDLT
eukprot:TRINITY_DN8151_c0_g1_i1.p1 TRINITY_DN8151_c0_g1~~TRINITY_DN8151_c0_g1_i1.p1  ORF type:complete len:169 (+),score=14.56 TRINITY_DN8151_c0_g1_i1:59-565(+)